MASRYILSRTGIVATAQKECIRLVEPYVVFTSNVRTVGLGLPVATLNAILTDRASRHQARTRRFRRRIHQRSRCGADQNTTWWTVGGSAIATKAMNTACQCCVRLFSDPNFFYLQFLSHHSCHLITSGCFLFDLSK